MELNIGPYPTPIITLTSTDTILCRGRPIEELTEEELHMVIRDLVDLLLQRHI